MNEIIIKNANENNLKNVDLTLPRGKIIVFSGVSGSGKSTMAFDTIFAEGQRRYVESLSSYARMFLGQMKKPDVESIVGLSPAVSIDQKTTNANPRSTVGTVTEIYDYFRLLFANIGTAYCPNCNKPISKTTIDQITEKVLELKIGTKIIIKAPVVRGQKGTFAKTFDSLRKNGYARVEVDGVNYLLDEEIELDKNKKHTISVVVDRLVIEEDCSKRLVDSLETTNALSGGLIVVSVDGKEDLTFNTNYACFDCGSVVKEISPRLFSFNSPFGACPNCDGLGVSLEVDLNKLVKEEKSLRQGAIHCFGFMPGSNTCMAYYEALSKKFNFSIDTPFKNLDEKIKNIILYGTKEKMNVVYYVNETKKESISDFEGVVNIIKRRFKETTSSFAKEEYRRVMSENHCKVCNGKRLNKEALSVKIDGFDICQVCDKSANELLKFVENLKLDKEQKKIASPIIKEIVARLNFLINVGIGYLTLNRSSGTLSGGEAQRIRLATQIGSGLSGVLYILDEPSIGLHQRDNDKLLATLKNLKELGNTLIVVEHDEDTILSADHIVDFGPKAGVHGGQVIAQGSVKDIISCEKSLTGQYLSGKRKIEVPKKRRDISKVGLKVTNAHQNNLKNISIQIPMHALTCVTGVSGSGKSSLVNEIIAPALTSTLNRANATLGSGKVEGIENFDKCIVIDQSPIGRTPRSNCATYTGVWNFIRELFASTIESKERGYSAGRFSFNVPGGRCEHCQGDGEKKIEMYFLPDVYVPCSECEGKRYNKETLEVKYKGLSIADVLDLTVEEALKFFENIPQIKNKIQALYDVGLSYIKLGQSATTLSGGEAQRVKLAAELSKRSTGKTIYILDEPTTGLHFYDVHKLIKILDRLVDSGNTVVVIEHNLDMIKVADYIIDLGPEGGDEGGQVVATGTPEDVAKVDASYTGKFLKKILSK